jgi:hypothetical protein
MAAEPATAVAKGTKVMKVRTASCQGVARTGASIASGVLPATILVGGAVVCGREFADKFFRSFVDNAIAVRFCVRRVILLVRSAIPRPKVRAHLRILQRLSF